MVKFFVVQYAILLNPGHNHVYFDAAQQLSLAEFSFLSNKLGVACHNPHLLKIAEVPYLSFETDHELSVDNIRLLGRLSFAYALFIVDSSERPPAMRPVDIAAVPFVPKKISSLLKYTGKTNEKFTRLMINVAVAVSDFPISEAFRLLDPLAGKGTTLFEGLVEGFDVWGIDQSKKYTGESIVFFKKFLEAERMKHAVATETLHTADGGKAHKTTFTLAKTKADQKRGETHTFSLVAGDACHVSSYFKKTHFHIIISDLPYGIQHKNVSGKNKTGATRNPKYLLDACLAVWHQVLLPGGAIVLAWNTFVLPRSEMAKTLESFGFTVVPPAPPNAFLHRVDQAINRDIIIAKKEK